METLCYASPELSLYILYNMPTRPPDSDELALEDRRNFVRNFKNARKQANITQEELVKRTGLTQAFISNIEKLKTNFSLDNASILANAVGIPLWQLLSPPEKRK